MTFETGTGKPTKNGYYVCQCYGGWRTLDWYEDAETEGEWWFPEFHATWGAGDPLQWIGPLPEIGRTPRKPVAGMTAKSTQDFDL